jgi:predicted nucleic acid-binding protein
MTKKQKFVVDTNILVRLLRGEKRAQILLNQVKPAYVSTVTAMELYAGAVSSQHRKSIDTLLSSAKIIDVSLPIAKKTAYLVKKHPEFFGKKVLHGVADAFITATGIYLNLPILTLDKRHFAKMKSKEVEIIVFKRSQPSWRLS